MVSEVCALILRLGSPAGNEVLVSKLFTEVSKAVLGGAGEIECNTSRKSVQGSKLLEL